MLRKPLHAWLSRLACLLLAGCGGVSVSVLLFDEFPHNQAQPLAFQQVLPAFDSAIGDHRLVVVRDLASWDVLWREHTAGLLPPPAMPPINFSQNMVIGVFPGMRNNFCIAAEIHSIWQHTHPARNEVDYREIARMPDINGQCPARQGNFAALVVLEYSFLPVEFFQVD